MAGGWWFPNWMKPGLGGGDGGDDEHGLDLWAGGASASPSQRFPAGVHTCVCVLWGESQLNRNMGFTGNLGGWAVGMKEMMGKVMYNQKRGVFTAGSPVVRTSKWEEEKGDLEEKWPETGGEPALTALERHQSERVHCQQCQLLHRVEIRSLDLADSSWPFREQSQKSGGSIPLNNEWEMVWRKGWLIPLRLTKVGRRSWEGKVVSEKMFF